MQTRNLPTIDAGYWAAIVAASMCGANTGDLAAGPLGLGHIKGVLPLAIVFLAIVFAEKSLKWTTVAFYWCAIIVLRTMATNLADYATHDPKLSYIGCSIALALFMAVMIFIDKQGESEPVGVLGRDGVWRSLPSTNWNYWITMLAAGTLGTALGDWIADRNELGLGVYWGSALCAPLFVAALWLGVQYGKLTKPWYWVVIVACRTLGTDLGDMLVALFRTAMARPTALWTASILTGLLLAAIVYFWKQKTQAQLTASQ